MSSIFGLIVMVVIMAFVVVMVIAGMVILATIATLVISGISSVALAIKNCLKKS